MFICLFLFNASSTTELYTLSLHDALPISAGAFLAIAELRDLDLRQRDADEVLAFLRSEEHTSELQSRPHLVCRLLLEKKNTTHTQLSDSAPQPKPALNRSATARQEAPTPH